MELRRGQACLKEQVGSAGYYAAISVEAEIDEGCDGPIIRFADSVDPCWREAAAVGARVGWRRLPARYTRQKQAVITIQGIDSIPCDTTEVVVLFVAAKAVLSLFDADHPGCPAFVPQFGAFLFGP